MNKAVAKGYRWVAYQWNDENYGAYNRSVAPQVREACAGRLVFTIWLTRPFDAASARQAAVESGCQGIILEGEIPAEWVNPSGVLEPKPDAVNWPECVFHLQDLPIPKACVTNFAPFVHHDGSPWPDKASPLINAGWACITECFITESPNSTPANTDFYAKSALDWPTTQPMVEGWHLADYGDLSAYANVSHWDAGNVLG